MQGASAVFAPSIIAILTLPHNQCPSQPINASVADPRDYLYNDTDGAIVDGTELWQRRMRQVSAAGGLGESGLYIARGRNHNVGHKIHFSNDDSSRMIRYGKMIRNYMYGGTFEFEKS